VESTQEIHLIELKKIITFKLNTREGAMKAAVMVQTKKPWEIRTLPDPIAKEDQVVIKIHASGMCGTDVHVYEGLIPVRAPFVLGHEPVGEIVQVGPGVTYLKVGDRVGVSWFQKGCGRCGYCQRHAIKYCNGQPGGPQTWMQLGGGNSELMVAWAEGCTLLPKDLSYEQAAPLFCAGYTVSSGYWNADPKPGEKIAILGMGGLGHIALQYAKAKGHPVVVLTQSADKVQLAKELGADEVILTGDNAGKALAKAGGANIILNTGNSSKLSSQSLEGLLPEGRFVSMGVDKEPIYASPILLLSKQIKIIGSEQNHRGDLVDILELAAKGKVKTLIETYPLDEINKALDRLIAGKVRMRAVIQVAG
jgi:D-arabinose 1-dehydrogenase-like Zn-dependent alcohol dehydrogenase